MTRIVVILCALALIAVVAGCESNGPTESNLNIPVRQIAQQFIPADATLDSATLYVTAVTTNSQTINLHAVTSAWSEGSVTWNSFGGAFNATALAAVAVNAPGQVALDVLPTVQSWFDSTAVNNGLLLRQVGTALFTSSFDSREGTGTAATLKVCFTTFEGPSCETFDVSADAYIYQGTPDQNFGSNTLLYTGQDGAVDSVYQSLLDFTVPVEIRYATLGDFVWEDVNRNGIQDAGEPGFADLTVTLYTCGDEMVESTVTDANGAFEFDSLPAGEYYITVDIPEGYGPTTYGAGVDNAADSDFDPISGKSDCVTLNPGVTDLDLDIGLIDLPASVGDLVWNDENMNGLQDEGEVGIEGIAVILYTCEDVWVAETTTDDMGMYLFDTLDAGSYYLEFVNPFGYIFTYRDADDDALDSDVDRYQKRTVCFDLEPGEEDLTWDAGLFEFDGCTFSKGYWKNHAGFGPQPDSLSKLLPIWLGNDDGAGSMPVADAATAVDILQQHEYGHPSNGITKLYAQLLAAKLNIVNFANPEDIHEAIADADAFLADYNWEDWGELSKEDRQQVLHWKDMLNDYNNGGMGPGSCDDDNDDDEEEEDDDE